MTKKLPKTKFVWKVALWRLPIQVEVPRKEKLKPTGYIAFFESKKDAVSFKTRQLSKIAAQFDYLDEPLPKMYSKQITEMEKEYGKEKSVSE